MTKFNATEQQLLNIIETKTTIRGFTTDMDLEHTLRRMYKLMPEVLMQVDEGVMYSMLQKLRGIGKIHCVDYNWYLTKHSQTDSEPF